MKKILLSTVVAASCFSQLAAENFYPNGGFEKNWRPIWNRMCCESYLAETPGWSLAKGVTGQCLQSDGSGRALELQFEAPTWIKVNLDIKGEK